MIGLLLPFAALAVGLAGRLAHRVRFSTAFVFVQRPQAQNDFVLAFVGVNGLIEAIVCAVVGTAISKALYMFLYKDRA